MILRLVGWVLRSSRFMVLVGICWIRVFMRFLIWWVMFLSGLWGFLS